MNSTPWHTLEHRDDDVVIASWGKSGTTWLQQIVAQLVFRGDPEVDVAAISPWLESLWPPAETKLRVLREQSHRRFIKTHLPPDEICFSDAVRYVYVARHGVDVAFSLYRHLRSVDDDGYRFLALLGAKHGCGERLERPVGSFREFWNAWLYGNGYPMWPFWENVGAWWKRGQCQNVLLIHFNQLRSHLARSIADIAEFLSIPVDRGQIRIVQEHCSLKWMKRHAELSAPSELRACSNDGSQSFFRQGTHGQWRDELTETDVQPYYEIAATRLGPECASWLHTGETRRPSDTDRAFAGQPPQSDSAIDGCG